MGVEEKQKSREELFVGLEYAIQQYMEKNVGKVVDGEYKYLRNKQVKEYQQRWENQGAAMASSSQNAAAPLAAHRYASSGEWGRKDSEYVLNQSLNKVAKSASMGEDAANLVQWWRNSYMAAYGEEQYIKLSKQVEGGDLAWFYFNSRMEGFIVDRLAKKDVPKNSLEFILTEGINHSFAGKYVFSSAQGEGSATEERRRARIKELYNPGSIEKTAAAATSFGLDAATFGGYGSAATVGMKILRAGFILLDSGTHLSTAFAGSEDASRKTSKMIFGDESAMTRWYNQAKNYSENDVRESVIVHEVNKSLQRKLYHITFNKGELKDYEQKIRENANGDGQKMSRMCVAVLKQGDMKVEKHQAPAWMLSRSERDNIASGASFLAIACKMKETGLQVKNVGGHMMTLQEVSQRAYDYSRAAYEQSMERKSREQIVENRRERENEREEEQRHSAEDAVRLREAKQLEEQRRSAEDAVRQRAEEYRQQQASQQQQGLHGGYADNGGYGNGGYKNPFGSGGQDLWGRLFQNSGLSGIGGLGKNLGYSIAMLPDMLIGMFTGRNPKMKLDENILPLAAILMGVFISRRRHPLLKLMLLLLGGLGILSKVSEAVNGPQQQPVRRYQQVSEEPLNRRLQNPAIKGNVMEVTIDGRPVAVSLSSMVADAYQKGSLPLNNIANRVLLKYDEQGGADGMFWRQEQSERQLAMARDEEIVERSRGMR
jgi:hypothetical protein